MLARFARARNGNIAAMFAIAVVPILSFVGVAVDYSRMNSARSAMQGAMDSAVLMVAKDIAAGTITSDQVTAKTTSYFKALYTNSDAGSATVAASYNPTDTSGSTITASGSSSISTQFMKIVGFPTIAFDTRSTATWGTSRMRVALVLDVTGSMLDDNKMPNMISAAQDMVDTLSKFNKNDGDIYISLVPFAKDVNVGAGTAAANYTTGWAAWEAEPASIKTNKPDNWKNYGPGAKCPFTSSAHGFVCASTAVNGSATTSTVPSGGIICPGLDRTSANYYNGCYSSTQTSGTTTLQICNGKNCDCSDGIGGNGSSCSCSGSGSGKSCSETLRNYSHTWVVNDHNTWNGCVLDRDQNNDTKNTAPLLGDNSTLFYVEQWSSCPNAIVPMSNSWSTLKTKIGNLVPDGNTNQSIGLAWGWLTLGTSAPFPAPVKDSRYTYKDYIVLLSDGQNTQNRWYNNAADIDARQAILCQNVKDAGVTIYTIQINTGTGKNKDPESAVLKNCATEKFQQITVANQTSDAFKEITNDLARLRVSK